MAVVVTSICRRNESPTSICFPVTVTCMGYLKLGRRGKRCSVKSAPSARRSYGLGRSVPSSKPVARSERTSGSHLQQPLAPTLHRGGDAHRLAIFRHGASRDVDPFLQ